MSIPKYSTFIVYMQSYISIWIIVVFFFNLYLYVDSSSLVFFGFFCLFAFSRGAPKAHGGSQTRGLVVTVATSLHQSHSNVGSKPPLQPTPQLTATPDL